MEEGEAPVNEPADEPSTPDAEPAVALEAEAPVLPAAEAAAVPAAEAASEEAPAAVPTRRRGRGRWIAIGLILLLILVAGGAGGYYENGVLNARYSPQRAVLDYFAAQGKGDAAGMLANATFLRPDGSYAQFFNGEAVKAMLLVPENTAISNLHVISIETVDSSTARANVSMTWAGKDVSTTYTIAKDTSETHYLLYDSWRIRIPSTTITVSLPNQPGSVLVDGIEWPAGAALGSIQLIAGYHKFEMLPTPFWQSESQTANAVLDSPTVKFKGNLSSEVSTAAATAVKSVFGDCDASKYNTCFGHTYHSAGAAYTIYYFTVPGYGDIQYNYYVFNLTGDPTTGMTLTVTGDAGNIAASGTCTATMTVDGSRNYAFKGTWSGTLTWTGSAFSSNLAYDCLAAKA